MVLSFLLVSYYYYYYHYALLLPRGKVRPAGKLYYTMLLSHAMVVPCIALRLLVWVCIFGCRKPVQSLRFIPHWHLHPSQLPSCCTVRASAIAPQYLWEVELSFLARARSHYRQCCHAGLSACGAHSAGDWSGRQRHHAPKRPARPPSGACLPSMTMPGLLLVSRVGKDDVN